MVPGWGSGVSGMVGVLRAWWAAVRPSLIQSDNSGMKLATYKDGSRDGQLVVVSRDLTQAHYASHIANRLQQVLDDWNFLSPQLQDLSDALNAGRARHAFAFDPAQCLAPLPRAFQWVDGAAYPSHVQRVQQTRDAEPQMVQHASDDLLGPCAPLVCASEDQGLDFEAGLAAITGDVPMGCPSDRAIDGVRLLVLVNGVCLRQWAAGGPESRPTGAFSPVAITPDELGEAWSRGRVHLPLQTTWNGRKVGMCDAGADMGFHFGQLIAHLCQTRQLRAGAIVGTGPVRNKGVEKKGRTDWPKGYHCIAEKRAMETAQDGQPSTGYLRFGDTLRIEMKGRDGQSLFGAIAQDVLPRDAAATLPVNPDPVAVAPA